MNNREREQKRICLKIVKNEKARSLMHNREYSSFMDMRFEWAIHITEWGKRIYKILGW